MLESLRWQVRGRAAHRLQASFARQADVLLQRLLIEGTALWEREGFSRWDDGELACTVRLFDCCDRVAHASSRGWAALVRIQYDGAQPTPGMRRGLEDPRRARRPDLIVFLGSDSILLEAKKLHLGDNLPSLYVREGMQRFIFRHYSSSIRNEGAMVGYILRDAPLDVIAAVNAVIESDPGLGRRHALRLLAQPSPAYSLVREPALARPLAPSCS